MHRVEIITGSKPVIQVVGKLEPVYPGSTQVKLVDLAQVENSIKAVDQQALIVMMDSLVKKSDVTRVIGKMARG